MNTAIVTTARHCTPQTYEYICGKLQARFGPLSLEHRVDDAVLGGFLVQLNGTVYDCTLRFRLEQMRRHLTGG